MYQQTPVDNHAALLRAPTTATFKTAASHRAETDAQPRPKTTTRKTQRSNIQSFYSDIDYKIEEKKQRDRELLQKRFAKRPRMLRKRLKALGLYVEPTKKGHTPINKEMTLKMTPSFRPARQSQCCFCR